MSQKLQKVIIAKNKKAAFNYFLEETLEAGIVLMGSEVKAIRLGKVNIADSYAGEIQNEIYLINSYIGNYQQASMWEHEPKRNRKLLLTSREIKKIIGKIKIKGYSLIVSSLYFNPKNIIKVELAVAKGKKLYDKRQTIKNREWQRRKGQSSDNY